MLPVGTLVPNLPSVHATKTPVNNAAATATNLLDSIRPRPTRADFAEALMMPLLYSLARPGRREARA